MKKTLSFLALSLIFIPYLSIAGIYVDLGGGGSTSTSTIENGTATGQMAYWDSGELKWKHTELTELLWDDVNKFLGINNSTPEVGLHLGPTSSTRGLTGVNDAIISGSLNVINNSYFETLATFGDGLTFEGGSIHTWAGGYREIRGIDDGQRLGLNDTDNQGNNNLVITTSTNLIKDHDHDILSANPTIYLHDSTDPDIDNTRSLKLTYGLIEAQSGDLKLDAISGVVKSETFALVDSANDFYGLFYPNADNGLMTGLSSTDGDSNNYEVLTTLSNITKDHGLNTPAPDPTRCIFSSDDVDVDDTNKICETHDGNDAIIYSGKGNIKLQPFVSVEVDAARLLTDKGSDIVSANDITLGTDGNYFDITGTTQINTIASIGWIAGTTIILQFDASVTVKHNTAGTGASLLLAGAADFAATADDTLMLVYDGTTWREISRTVI